MDIKSRVESSQWQTGRREYDVLCSVRIGWAWFGRSCLPAKAKHKCEPNAISKRDFSSHRLAQFDCIIKRILAIRCFGLNNLPTDIFLRGAVELSFSLAARKQNCLDSILTSML